MQKLSFFVSTLLLMTLMSVGLILAAPPAQNNTLLPTPTLPPIDESTLVVDLTVIGGQPITYTLPADSGDTISVTVTTVDPQYPTGIVFRTTVEADAGDVEVVRLNARFVRDNGGDRVQATYDETTDQWVAHLWPTGSRIPAWFPMYVSWIVTDSNGTFWESSEHFIEYADESREWYWAALSEVDLYWSGDLGIAPEDFAQEVALALAQTDQRRYEVFGGPLDYRPRAIVFGSYEMFAEMYPPGSSPLGVNGFTIGEQGIVVQWAGPYPAGLQESFDAYIGPNCTFYPRTGDADYLIYDVIPHEIGHVYQFEYDQFSTQFSNWWIEGQAVWLQTWPDPSDERLRAYAAVDPNFLPLIQNPSISREIQGSDGCPRLVYAIGHSFVNWLYANYGGTELAHQISRNIADENMSVYEAIAAATGVDFLTLENGWRAYIGFNQLRPEDLDPSLLLEDAPNALFAPSDSVVIPGPRPVTLMEVPGGRIGQAQCFAGTLVAVLRVGTLDGLDWYEVDCNGLRGWLTADDLQ